MGLFSIVITATEIESVAESLSKIDSESLGRAAVRAVNDVAKNTYESATGKMLSGINLTRQYVDSHMRVVPATDPKKPEAEIVAMRKAVRGATLTTYGARVVTKQVNWPNGSFTPGAYGMNPRKPGSPLPWKPRTGDASRGVPVNSKANGFIVSVAKGQSKHFLHSSSGNTFSFVIPVKGGTLLTVKRKKNARGRGAIQALRGPSVWQLFRTTAVHIRGDVEKDLMQSLEKEVDKVLEKL